MAQHTFHACPDCGATVRNDYIELHQGWHDERDTQPELELELDQSWPEGAPAIPPSTL